jgi:protein-disulfide isomerase
MEMNEPMVSPMYQEQGGSKILTYVVIFLAGLVIGYLFNRVRTLEKGVGTAGVGTTGNVAANGAVPTAAPVVKQDLKVEKDDPTMGQDSAKVTIVTFEDFQCPFCGAFSGLNETIVKSMQSQDATWQPALTNLIKDYVETGKAKLVWKDYPFLGAESNYAGAAARCAQDQGKFWEYHDYLFSHQNGENQGAFSKDNLKKFAGTLGLNTGDFNNCVDSDKYAKKMTDAATYGQGVGVSGTPATFINGRMVSGAVPYSQFKTIVEEELKK